MVARLFTDKQEAEICKRYSAGESAIKTSKDLGCSNATISKIIKRNNYQMRRSGGRAINLVDVRFYRLVVFKLSDRRTPSGGVYWWCRCDCGNTREVASERLSHKKLKDGKNAKECKECGLKTKISAGIKNNEKMKLIYMAMPKN